MQEPYAARDTMQTIVSTLAILLGAVIMLFSVIRSGNVLAYTPLISQNRRRAVVTFLRLHRVLMMFFLLGYLVVAAAFLFDLSLVGEIFVAAVFLFGAAFVLMGILIQSRMLVEIDATIHGLLPMCSRCRRIRPENQDPGDRKSWIKMEEYVTERTDARGFCPECMDELYGLPENMRPEH